MRLNFLSIFILVGITVSNAQINLDHTFNESVTWLGSIYMEQNLYPSDCYHNASIDGNSYVVKIYNSDYSVNTNNTYYFTPPSGYEVNTLSMSKNLFNDDDDYEFMVSFTKIETTNDNTKTKLHLLGQSGNLLKDFGTAYSIYTYSYLHIANNNFRLIVAKYYYDGTNLSTETEIYSVPGTPPTSSANLKLKEFQSPYPNPANSLITLPYKLKHGEMTIMNIYNTNGKLIETKQIDFVFDKILLNVSNYSKGIYFYEVNGISEKFIVE